MKAFGEKTVLFLGSLPQAGMETERTKKNKIKSKAQTD